MGYKTSIDKKDWFRAVRRDSNQIADAIEYFYAKYDEAFDLASIEGNMIKVNTQHAGYLAHFQHIAKQAEHIAAHYEREAKLVRAAVLHAWDKNPPTNLRWNTTEIKIMLEQEQAVIDADTLFQEINYIADLWKAFVGDFRNRSFSMNTAAKLLMTGNGEAEYDPYD